ncbi:hypothetical protein CYMTET_52596 [Cymbomonas tetramitiformis]|uniref:Uncharacterized protein n=1 Tax=Cymbomonas tetramitiformis TaxID=36881 RepID=A0AAE0ER70_9CHLO|nr:hypothetical protein CYMTET_52596 [Cymbomonas tetramitiformis]
MPFHLYCYSLRVFLLLWLLRIGWSCSSFDLSVPANGLLSESNLCFQENGKNLASFLRVQRDSTHCNRYLIVRNDLHLLASAAEACQEHARTGPGLRELDFYQRTYLQKGRKCHVTNRSGARTIPASSPVSSSTTQGGVPAESSDSGVTLLTEGCIHNFLNLAKSKEHQLVLQGHMASGDPAGRETARTSATHRATIGVKRSKPVPPPSSPAPKPAVFPVTFPEPLAAATSSAEFEVHEVEFEVPLAVESPNADFVVRVFGESTLSSGWARQKLGSTFVASFQPAETGLHRVEIRLEYLNRTQVITGVPTSRSNRHRFLPAGRQTANKQPKPLPNKVCASHACTVGSDVVAAAWIGVQLPPVYVQVLPQKESFSRSALPPCQGGDQRGFWSHRPGSAHSLPTLAATQHFPGCPNKCLNASSTICETPGTVGRVQLYHGPSSPLSRPPSSPSP